MIMNRLHIGLIKFNCTEFGVINFGKWSRLLAVVTFYRWLFCSVWRRFTYPIKGLSDQP
jgi:hypothetical protein